MENGSGKYESCYFLGFCLFPVKPVGSTFGAGIGEWFSIDVEVKGIRGGAGERVGVWPGKTHFGGKSSGLPVAAPFVPRALGW